MTIPRKFTFPYALTVPFRISPVITSIIILHQIISLAIAPIQVLVTAYFIDTALSVFNEGKPPELIIPPIIAFIAFNAYHRITAPLLELASKRREIKTRLALRVPFVQKRARLEFKHTENNDTADLINRVWEGPEYKISQMLENLTGFINMVGQTASYAVILIAGAPLAGSLLIVLSVPIFIISIKGGKQQYEANRETTKLSRTFWSLSWFLTAGIPASERNLFGFSKHMSEMHFDAFEKARKHRLKTSVKWFVRSKASAIILGSLSALALFILAPSVVSGRMSVGSYISIIGALFSAVNGFGWSIPYHFEQFATHREILKDINKFLELSETDGAEVLPSKNPPVFEKLEFKNVSFTYPGTEKKILDSLSFSIENGKHYSFVGINGAGKTTLTKLITRLYDEYEGEILLNGKPLRQYPMSDIKALFCAVFQDYAKYDITVAENIAVGKANGAKPEEIDRAIELAGFSEKAARLKNGKDTLLGKTQDTGEELSGGEWQRLAFARAVISPAPVKILDEPTAALDPVEESRVYAKFEEISRGITTFFISHRLASAKMSDTIFVLDGGKIAECGSHNELMRQNGIYAEMFESQRSWYM